MLLKNKKALVTGSSRGIGRKIVEVFLANGCEVWGMCTKESAGKAELEKLAAENGTAFHEFYADAGNAEVLTTAVKNALGESGGCLCGFLQTFHFGRLCAAHKYTKTKLLSFPADSSRTKAI